MTISNRLSILIAEKAMREKRRISLAEISRDTGIGERTLIQWAHNTITRYDAAVLDALCAYFRCDPGDLLIKVE